MGILSSMNRMNAVMGAESIPSVNSRRSAGTNPTAGQGREKLHPKKTRKICFMGGFPERFTRKNLQNQGLKRLTEPTVGL